MSFQPEASAPRPYLAAAILLAALAAVAPFNAAADDNMTRHGLIDTDGDKRISYAEFVHSVAVQAMKEMDEDKDGLVSRSEASEPSTHPQANPASVKFSDADANGDDRVGLSEMEKPVSENSEVRKAFNDLDKDKDGYLSGPELNAIDNGTQMRILPQIRLSF